MTKKQKETFLSLVREGKQIGTAAKEIGSTRRDVTRYIKDHEDFAADVEDAQQEALEPVLDAVYTKAKQGVLLAAFRILVRHDPRWAEGFKVTTATEPPSEEASREEFRRRGIDID